MCRSTAKGSARGVDDVHRSFKIGLADLQVGDILKPVGEFGYLPDSGARHSG